MVFVFPGEKIPPKATLIFEVELLDVQDGPKPENIFKKIDTDEDNKLSREEVWYSYCVGHSQVIGMWWKGQGHQLH